MEELRLGSIATGIGFAWTKFIAFAADWDHDPNKDPIVLPNGIEVVGWDMERFIHSRHSP